MTPRSLSHGHALPAQRWKLPTHWPLTIVVLGFPLWWAMGLRTILPMVLTVVMADQLLRRRKIALPRGFAVWAMFLAWMALGVFVLFADAPDAVPGGNSSRILIFAYRGCLVPHRDGRAALGGQPA